MTKNKITIEQLQKVFVGKAVSITHPMATSPDKSGVCVAINHTEPDHGLIGIDLVLEDGSRWGMLPEQMSDDTVSGPIASQGRFRREVTVKSFTELTTAEAKLIVRRITKTSRSADEIKERLTEAGFNGQAAMIATQQCGDIFQAIVMVWGPNGEIIS